MTGEERELVDRCRAGDDRAWTALYRAHARGIGRFLRAVLGRRDVEDLVQRVFLEFLGSLPRFRGEAGVATWLHRIAANLARTEVRGGRRRARALAGYADEVKHDHEAAPLARVLARERLAALEGAAAALPWKFRVVWVLREVQRLSVEEVAAALGERPATVRTRHHRARGRIEAALSRARAAREEAAAAHGEPDGAAFPEEVGS